VNKLSSALGAIAVIAIAVVFILQFRPASNAQRTDTGPQCAVEVRGTCIPGATFKAARRLIASNADAGKLRSMGFGKKVADGLVEAWILGEDAKRLGLAVDDEEVTAEIASGRAHVSLPAADVRQLGYSLQLGEDLVRQIPVKSPKSPKAKKFDAKYAEKQIRFYSMMSPAEFRDYQRSEILAARMREIIKSRVRVSENEAFDRSTRTRSTRSGRAARPRSSPSAGACARSSSSSTRPPATTRRPRPRPRSTAPASASSRAKTSPTWRAR
jgi:peptidyl-prolyl cis-trans isomerase D